MWPIQRDDGKEVPSSKPSSLDTFLKNYSNYMEDAQTIDLDLEKLVNDYNDQVNSFDVPPSLNLPKDSVLLSKDQIKTLGSKFKCMSEQKLLMTMTNIQKLNTKLNQEYTAEINHAIELGILERERLVDDE